MIALACWALAGDRRRAYDRARTRHAGAQIRELLERLREELGLELIVISHDLFGAGRDVRPDRRQVVLTSMAQCPTASSGANRRDRRPFRGPPRKSGRLPAVDKIWSRATFIGVPRRSGSWGSSSLRCRRRRRSNRCSRAWRKVAAAGSARPTSTSCASGAHPRTCASWSSTPTSSSPTACRWSGPAASRARRCPSASRAPRWCARCRGRWPREAGASVFLLGGDPGVADARGRAAAPRAAPACGSAARHCPPFGFETTRRSSWRAIERALPTAAPRRRLRRARLPQAGAADPAPAPALPRDLVRLVRHRPQLRERRHRAARPRWAAAARARVAAPPRAGAAPARAPLPRRRHPVRRAVAAPTRARRRAVASRDDAAHPRQGAAAGVASPAAAPTSRRFPRREGGLVLSATINRYAYGTLRPRDDGTIGVECVDFGVSVDYGADDDARLRRPARPRQGGDPPARPRRLRPVPALERAARLGPRLVVGGDGRADRAAQGVPPAAAHRLRDRRAGVPRSSARTSASRAASRTSTRRRSAASTSSSSSGTA